MDLPAEESIGERLKHVLSKIQRATEASGRPDGTVRLVAATKTVSSDRIREAIAAGLRLAGENRVQEALPKIETLKDEAIKWHFIGHLQRRKVREIVGLFELIHSVDSLELAREIDRRAQAAGLRVDILLEVNIAGETTKAGFYSDDLERVLPQFEGLVHLNVKGLMAIPPPVENMEEARPYFRRLRKLAMKLERQRIPGVSMYELSMGMSNDYSVAIEEGATLVRIGTAIFGTRHV